MKPHDMRLIAIGRGVARRSAKRLCPVRRQMLGVLGVEAVTERVAHNLVGHHPLVPRIRKTNETSLATGGVKHRLHSPQSSKAPRDSDVVPCPPSTADAKRPLFPQ